jgi:uncharacterized protein (DUF305 family)
MKVVQTSSTVRSCWLAFIGAGVLSVASVACSSEQSGDWNSGALSTDNGNADELGDLTTSGLTETELAKEDQPYGCAVALTFIKDIEFIDYLVPRHRAGIAMDDIAMRRSDRAEVRQFARRDREERMRQVAYMLTVRERLTGRAEVPAAPADRKTDLDLAQLRTLSGREFESLYLRAVITNNVAVIDVCYRSSTSVETRAIRKLASDTFEYRAAQIAKIQVLRKLFSCDQANYDGGRDDDNDGEPDDPLIQNN